MEQTKDKKNIYKGNRYVPKHDDLWDINKDYESLTVVLWEGSSYTTRKYTPAGVDILNKEYWALSANFNGQIESYRQRVDEVESGFNTIKTNVTDNTNNIATNANNIATNTDNIATNTNNITENTNNITTNTNNIAENTNNIATNTDNIATNTNNITDLTLNVNQSRVNVLEFGLVNDGETDNTESLNNLLSYVKNNDITSIFFPKGAYYFSETITIDVNNLSIIGSGRRNTRLVFPMGVDGLTFKSGVVSPLVKELRIVTTRPNQPELVESWTDNAGLKFSTVSNENGASEVFIENVSVSNFFKGMAFRDYTWQSNFKEIRFDTCGYSIYQDDAYGHTSMQNIFEHIYSNNPYFGGLRINNMQAEFINLNMGSANETAYLMEIERSSNLVFTVPNFEHAYVNELRKEAITIKNDANVTIINPSLKDLKSTDSTILTWFGVYNNALLSVRNHRIYQTGSLILGNVYNRGMVLGQLDVSLSPLWKLVPDDDGTYKQRLGISKEKSAISNKIILVEDSNNRVREYLFQPSNRGKITRIKAMYIAPHASGYGELEVYQVVNNSKIKLANISVKSTSTVSKFDEVNLNMQTAKFETSSPVYVGGYGLGTLQVVVNYEE